MPYTLETGFLLGPRITRFPEMSVTSTTRPTVESEIRRRNEKRSNRGYEILVKERSMRRRNSEVLPLSSSESLSAPQPLLISHALPAECDLSFYSDIEQGHILSNWKWSRSKLTNQIQFAARWGFIDYLDKLTEENEVDLDNAGALYQATLHSRFAMVKHLVEKYHVNVNYYDSNQFSDLPLNVAVSKLDPTCVSYLLNKGASLLLKGRNFRNALQHCVDIIDVNINLHEKTVLVLRELIKAGISLKIDLSFNELPPREYLKSLQLKHPDMAAFIKRTFDEMEGSDVERSVTMKRPGR